MRTATSPLFHSAPFLPLLPFEGDVSEHFDKLKRAHVNETRLELTTQGLREEHAAEIVEEAFDRLWNRRAQVEPAAWLRWIKSTAAHLAWDRSLREGHS